MTIEQIKQDTLNEQKNLLNIVLSAIEMAKHRVDEVEVFIKKSTGINVNTRLGETENVEFNSDGALGITVYHNKRQGTASTNDLSKEAILQAIDMAISIMQYTSEDPYAGLGDSKLMALNPPDLDLFHPSTLSVEQGIKLAKETEQIALSHAGITSSEGGYFSSQHGTQVYGNSLGMLQGYRASAHSLSCSVIAEQNGCMERNFAYTSSREINELSSSKWVGDQAAKRTLSHLGATQLTTMKSPVLFAPEVAVGLIGHLINAISGHSIYKKSSFLLDHIEKSIFPSWLTIHEDPHVLKGIGSSPFDREGMQTVKRNIVEEGVLKTYLLNNYSARKLGLQSTGHAGGIHNWFVSPSDQSLDFKQMLKKLDRGIVVTSVMGQGVNTITGNYSRGASGFWVENGQIKYPINEITIAGNLKDIYQNIIAIGNDLEKRTSIQCGSILVENMSIAGK